MGRARANKLKINSIVYYTYTMQSIIRHGKIQRMDVQMHCQSILMLYRQLGQPDILMRWWQMVWYYLRHFFRVSNDSSSAETKKMYRRLKRVERRIVRGGSLLSADCQDTVKKHRCVTYPTGSQYDIYNPSNARVFKLAMRYNNMKCLRACIRDEEHKRRIFPGYQPKAVLSFSKLLMHATYYNAYAAYRLLDQWISKPYIQGYNMGMADNEDWRNPANARHMEEYACKNQLLKTAVALGHCRITRYILKDIIRNREEIMRVMKEETTDGSGWPMCDFFRALVRDTIILGHIRILKMLYTLNIGELPCITEADEMRVRIDIMHAPFKDSEHPRYTMYRHRRQKRQLVGAYIRPLTI